MARTRNPILRNGTRVAAVDGCGPVRRGVVVDHRVGRFGTFYDVLMEDGSIASMPVGYTVGPVATAVGWYVLPVAERAKGE